MSIETGYGFYQDPTQLREAAEREMDGIETVELFNNSQYQKLRESWCAAILGVGYGTHVHSCQVRVNDTPDRMDVDLYLLSEGVAWEFQLAEVQEPGRKRGWEYKQFAQRPGMSIEYDAEIGKVKGPEWLSDGARKKKAKRYSSSENLNLLLYANFSALGLEYADVASALAPYREDFASAWVMTSLHLCSAFSSEALGEIAGWGNVRPIEDYYPA